jgi:hypothetical protein
VIISWLFLEKPKMDASVSWKFRPVTLFLNCMCTFVLSISFFLVISQAISACFTGVLCQSEILFDGSNVAIYFITRKLHMCFLYCSLVTSPCVHLFIKEHYWWGILFLEFMPLWPNSLDRTLSVDMSTDNYFLSNYHARVKQYFYILMTTRMRCKGLHVVTTIMDTIKIYAAPNSLCFPIFVI